MRCASTTWPIVTRDFLTVFPRGSWEEQVLPGRDSWVASKLSEELSSCDTFGWTLLESDMPEPKPATPPAPERYITIHGHFYQPPRENPWLETVETQDSAAPYHDWNERITAECYAPNGASRIVNPQHQIIRIINNYSRISFNFGPTLLSWLEENAPRAYKHILEADRRSQLRFGGHGSAIAQVYNHIIMPLSNTRDRVTQIRWGIADFESRFQRKPEGMWLA